MILWSHKKKTIFQCIASILCKYVEYTGEHKKKVGVLIISVRHSTNLLCIFFSACCMNHEQMVLKNGLFHSFK